MQERVKPKPKTMLTLEIDAALVAAARAKGVDLAALVEQALASCLNADRSQPLSEEDQASMDSYNRFIAEHGTLAEAFRKL